MQPEGIQRIDVHWPHDNQYHSGTGTSVNGDGICVMTDVDQKLETVNTEKKRKVCKQIALPASTRHTDNVLVFNDG